jgi:hypothetical protein
MTRAEHLVTRPSGLVARVPEAGPGTVVVFTEKHGSRYLDGTPGFLRVARRVFDDRDKEPFFEYPTTDPVPPTKPPPLPATDNGLEDMAYREAMRRWADYERRLRVWSYAHVAFNLAQEARGGDDLAAAKFLVMRQDHEYEGFSVEPLEVP